MSELELKMDAPAKQVKKGNRNRAAKAKAPVQDARVIDNPIDNQAPVQDTVVVEKENPGPHPPPAVFEQPPASALSLIQAAVAQGLSAETIEKLYDLHERDADRFEARSFNRALTAFQMGCPPVPRGGMLRHLTDVGTGQPTRYARLEDDILATVSQHLLGHGFSYAWDTETNNNLVKVTCKLRHVDGHEATASFQTQIDERPNQALSMAQRFGAVETYCRRMSFIQVTGVRTGDVDPDAAPGERISEDQALTLESLIESASANPEKFLKFMTIPKLEDMLASDYARAVNFLETKRKQGTNV